MCNILSTQMTAIICVLYLLYIAHTRATFTRSCTNCKFFLPLTTKPSDFSEIGKCMLYPYSDKTVNQLVIGMGEANIDGLFHYAITARITETMCGPDGTNFIKNPMRPVPNRRPLV